MFIRATAREGCPCVSVPAVMPVPPCSCPPGDLTSRQLPCPSQASLEPPGHAHLPLPRYHPSPLLLGLAGGVPWVGGCVPLSLALSLDKGVRSSLSRETDLKTGTGARTGCGRDPATRACPSLSGHLPGVWTGGGLPSSGPGTPWSAARAVPPFPLGFRSSHQLPSAAGTQSQHVR